jgi:hypothetical protein
VNIFRRLAVFALFLIFLLAVMLFWPFIFSEIIRPIALVVWVLLRVFVLSVDQTFLWAVIVVAVAFLLLRRLLLSPQPTAQSTKFNRPNATIEHIQYWHSLLAESARNAPDDRATKKQLAYLLLLLYATKKRTSADFRLYDALCQGEIPLPEHIHTFLFSEKLQHTERPIARLLQSICRTPKKWIWRWTGQEKTEYHRMINEVLTFVETSLEIKDDDGKLTSNRT